MPRLSERGTSLGQRGPAGALWNPGNIVPMVPAVGYEPPHFQGSNTGKNCHGPCATKPGKGGRDGIAETNGTLVPRGLPILGIFVGFGTLGIHFLQRYSNLKGLGFGDMLFPLVDIQASNKEPQQHRQFRRMGNH